MSSALPLTPTRSQAAIAIASTAPSAPRPRVLCVDDNALMRRTLERALASHFDVATAATAEAALAMHSADRPFAVVLTDWRMPGNDGLRLLKALRTICPETIRVLYSGNMALPATLEAINEIGVFRVLQAPFREGVLLSTMSAAIEHYTRQQAARSVLSATLSGCVSALSGMLAMARPTVFGRSQRVLRHVRDLANATNAHRVEVLEMATLLADIGALSLPAEVTERMDHRGVLTSDEQAMVRSLPTLADEVLAQIPGLSDVREILADLGTEPRARRDGSTDQPERHRGAGMLRIARDFDQGINSGLSAVDTLAAMRRRAGEYDLDLLTVFETLRGSPQATVAFVDIRITEIEVGMTFAQDVTRPDGVLLVARGQCVTDSLQHRFRHQWADSVQQHVVRMLRAPREPLGPGAA